jgi:site-specific recombinase XerD
MLIRQPTPASANCRTGRVRCKRRHLEPAAKEIGIVGHFGWHTFLHTYATFLKGNGEDVKVVQKLMRHANIPVTLSV